MTQFQATVVLIVMFALRCVLPLLLTMAVGYLMNRLVDRWEAEDRLAETLRPTPSQAAAAPTAPAVPTAESKPVIQLPCWLTKGCDPARRANCPAFQQQGTPCWLARLRAEGRLPADCPGCPVYRHAHA